MNFLVLILIEKILLEEFRRRQLARLVVTNRTTCQEDSLEITIKGYIVCSSLIAARPSGLVTISS